MTMIGHVIKTGFVLALLAASAADARHLRHRPHASHSGALCGSGSRFQHCPAGLGAFAVRPTPPQTITMPALPPTTVTPAPAPASPPAIVFPPAPPGTHGLP